MPMSAAEPANQYKFRDFLKSHRLKIAAVLLAAFFLRWLFVMFFPPEPQAGDSGMRYLPTALNILHGNGFSLDSVPPFRPSEACVPLYPLFVAAVYGVFGVKPSAVIAVQIVIDLLTCLLVAFVAHSLAPVRLKNLAAFSSLMIYGVFSWFTLLWSVKLLTENLAIFLTMLTIALVIAALKKERGEIRLWLAAGATCGSAILTRPDSVLLLAAVILFVSIRFSIRPSRKQFFSILSFCLATALMLAPWVVRNYLAFDKFQPLASEWAFAEGGYMPPDYLYWIQTWMIDETYFGDVFRRHLFPEPSRSSRKTAR